ncbi:ADP-ribose glycohydrolase MACROD1-like isoform X2 [Pristis pectinata]|uniref:ADP-ribose glycohydrolase MACROD1-like isoform X2 n=1 Tax=Pristis pectinata TaxID=685728 RepID=UPI00223E59E4|nr:ADP-ribose glycohydrolase MACROD1-like isoform X2 [Pristis pectinata]
MPFPIGRQLAFLLARRRSWERRGPRSVSASQQRAAGSNASRGQRPPACPLLSAGRPGSRLRLRHSPASAVTCASLSTSSASSMASKEFNPTFPTTDWSVAKKHLKELDHTERRSYYKAERFVILDEIQTWKDFSTEEKLKQPVTHYKKNDVLNEKVSLLQEDITKLEIDAIVNAVDGCIHMAAGPLLSKECSTLGGCSPGDAKITSGYCLPAKYVIHTVGPIVQGKERLPEKVLQSCYVTSLKLASDNNLRTIAFPCVSTGIYGYPNGQAAETVLKTVRQYLEEHRNSFDRIIFCVFLKIDYMLYKEKMPFYFPFDAVSPGSPKEKSKSADKDEKQTENTLKLGNGQGAK